MDAPAKVTPVVEFGTIEHLVKRQIPELCCQLARLATELDEEDGDEISVHYEFLAEVADALEQSHLQLQALRGAMKREIITLTAADKHDIADSITTESRSKTDVVQDVFDELAERFDIRRKS